MNMNMNVYDTKRNIPWIEKYRPNHFQDIVLDHTNRTLFQNIIRFGYFPNLLFYGSPGTGKTTTIMNLIHEYQSQYEGGGVLSSNTNNTHCNGKHRENIIHLNASDERGIDVIRIQINQFVRTKNMFEQGLKFVILDEVDYMTKNAQQSLKVLIQTCVYNVRFCLICNYISKIDESLQNEFICVRFNQLPKEEIQGFMRNISDKENMRLSDAQIETIQRLYRSDIRSMINFMQLNNEFGGAELVQSVVKKKEHRRKIDNNTEERKCRIDINIISDVVWETIYRMLESGLDPLSIIQYIHDASIQYNMDKRTLLTSYFEYTIRNKPDMITSDYLKVVEDIIHIHDDVPMESILMYFCNCMLDIMKTATTVSVKTTTSAGVSCPYK
jgi:replication factor C subunit 3/5